MSDQYAWDITRPEQSQELLSRYDVQAAKKLLVERPRVVEVLELRRYRVFFEEMLEGVHLREDVDWNSVDLELPVIFGTEDGRKFPLDGRHRLAKALRVKAEAVPIVVLTELETMEIRTAHVG